MIEGNAHKLNILTSQDWEDYALLDSGDNRKLEKFGIYKLIRPDKQAIWKPGLSEDDWKSAHAEFKPEDGETGGRWRINNQLPRSWTLRYKDLEFTVHLGDSKSIGVFPEQAAHWDWMRGQLQQLPYPANILNLFGYTGLASITAAGAGAQVTHVDASRYSIGLARDNQKLSGLSDRPIRWIVDDALKFVKREYRRNKRYDGIIMDPPKFGRGPKGEIWDVMRMLPKLLEECSKILSKKPLFLLITVYAVPISAITLRNLIEGTFTNSGGCIDVGEMGILERSKGRILPTAVFARWWMC
jgi:23S rRNA (cytosine1962-C5)-methyltransferase